MSRASGYDLTAIRLPEQLVWLLIAGWALVAVTEYAELQVLGVFAWNVAVAVLVLYGIQGVAIGLHLLSRLKNASGVWPLLVLALVLALFVRGIFLVIGIGVPALGVSELWVDYHRFKGSEEKDEGDS
jgi:hypothetical protein